MSTESFFAAEPPKLTRPTIIALVLVITFIVGTNMLWTLVDNHPPLWDIAGHSYRAADMTRLFLAPAWRDLLFYGSHYPPFAYGVAGLGFLVFGFQADVPQYMLQLFTIILLLSTFGVARRLLKRNSAAILATALTACAPLMAHFTRIFDLDIPLAAMVTLAVYVLIRTEAFHNRTWSAVFGLVCALGMLTKWTFALFIGPLGLLVLFLLMINPFIVQKGRNIWNALFLTVPIIFVLIVPWYITHAELIWNTAEETSKNIFSVPFTNLASFDNVTYYLTKMNYGFGLPIMLLALAGIVALVYRKRLFEPWVLLTWIIAPYAIMTFVFLSKESRYFLPVFPAVAILAAGILLYTKRRWFVIAIFVIAGIFSVIPWMETTTGARITGIDVASLPKPLRIYGYRTVTPSDPQFGFRKPMQAAQELRDAADYIATNWSQTHSARTPVVIVVPNSIFASPQQIAYYLELDDLQADNRYSQAIRQTGDNIQFLSKADYIITKTGDQGPPLWSTHLDTIVTEEQTTPSVFTEDFNFIGSATLSLRGLEKSNPQLRIYRHRDLQ